jgi:hypothetical protein
MSETLPNLPIEIINHILSLRPTHKEAVLINNIIKLHNRYSFYTKKCSLINPINFYCYYFSIKPTRYYISL